MLEKIKLLLKKRFSDVILVIAVIAVFFLTGKKRTDDLEIADSVNPTINEAEVGVVTDTSPTIPNQPSANNFETTNSVTPKTPQIPTPAIDQKKEIFQPPVTPPQPNSNQNIFPKTTNSNLGESLQNLKGKSASTEDIVNRNAYFQKLSKQLNELQGDVSSETTEEVQNEGSNNLATDTNTINNYPQNNIPVQVEENYNGNDGSQGNQNYPEEQFENNNLENPYNDLNRFPPPEVAQ